MGQVNSLSPARSDHGHNTQRGVGGEILDQVYRKVTGRLLPLLFVCYVIAYLDRVNIAFAKLQMQRELAMSDAVYGLGAGIFFVGYVLFEIPSNLFLARIGARKTLSRILILWGATSVSMILVRDARSFYALRFLLGVFEAGFAPGMLFYLTLWYSASRLASVTAAILVAAPVASVVGGPLSGWIMSALDGKGGLSGWQWMFLSEGLPAMGLGIVVLVCLSDSPNEATWLTATERDALSRDVTAAARPKLDAFADVLRDPAVYILGVVCFCVISGIYTVSFWLPTLLQDAGVAGVFRIGLYSAIPYVAAAGTMIGFARASDKQRRRRPYLVGLMLGSALFLAVVAWPSHSTWIGLVCITFATCCLWSGVSVFWAMPAEFLKGPAAAGAIALINSMGLVGGFVSPSLIGYVKTTTGSAQSGLWAMVGVLVCGAVLLASSGSGRFIGGHSGR